MFISIQWTPVVAMWCIVVFLQVALLSGPPGLGKTTLAHVIAKHAGYNVVEMNARLDHLEQNWPKEKQYI